MIRWLIDLVILERANETDCSLSLQKMKNWQEI